MNESLRFIALFFLPFVAYLFYSRIRLDQDHSMRKQKVGHHGRHFCGLDPSGQWILTDPFVEEIDMPTVSEAPVSPVVQSLQGWEPI
jgi:hypothetical protein